MPLFKIIKRKCTACPECSERFNNSEILEFLNKKKHFKRKGRWKIHKFVCENCGTIWEAKQFKDSVYKKEIMKGKKKND